MKTHLRFLVLFLFCFGFSKAQLILTKAANEPVAGDIRKAASYDSTSAIPKNTGLNQSWNFSSFTSGSYTETTNFVAASSASGYSLYAGATLAGLRGQNGVEFYKSGTNTFEFMGEYDISSGDFMQLTNTGVFFAWPISINNTYSDLGSGIEVSGSSTTALTGTLSYIASGTGTVTLPGGLVYNNCLQVISSILVNFGSGTNTMVMDQKNYQYFSNGKKFPIAEINYQTNTDLSGTTKDSWIMLNNMDAPVGINELEHSGNMISIFPNPADQVIHLNLPCKTFDCTIRIIDVNGKIVMNGPQQETLNVSGLDVGIYTLELIDNDNVSHQRFVINR